MDAAANTLTHGSDVRHLDTRAMDVLVLLCQDPGAVLAPETILARCWGQQDVSDNALHKVITQLRQALEDSRSAPRYIETIRMRGYRIIAVVMVDAAASPGAWQKGSPFRGLEAFEEQHAHIFFGRQSALERLQQTIATQRAGGHAMTLILGPSGSGKTSLVRAGLIPQLLQPAAGAGAPQFATALTFDCADIGDADVFDTFASALLDIELDNVPLFAGDSAASLGRRLGTEADRIVTQLGEKLTHGSLLLFIDRFEALFRLSHISEANRRSFLDLLERLAQGSAVVVVVACRNDFYPRLVEYPLFDRLIARGGQFNLTPPTAAEIAQMIRGPAQLAQLSFEQVLPSGARLDDELIHAATHNPDALPMLQYCLQELYRQRSPTGELLHRVFLELGGFDGALGARAEQVIGGLTPAQVALLPGLFGQLVIVSDDGLGVTARRVPWAALSMGPERDLVQAFVDARLFVSDLAGGVPAFGIAHEAMLRRWPRLGTWIQDHRLALQVRAHLSAQARRWQDNGRSYDLLLPAGLQADQAKQLLENRTLRLSDNEAAFVTASLTRVRRQLYRRRFVLGIVIGLAALAGWSGLIARSAQQRAEQLQADAEGLVSYMLGDFVEKLRPLGKLDLLDDVGKRAWTYLSGPQSEATTTASLAQRAKALQVLAEVKIARADMAGAKAALLAGRALLVQRLQQAPTDTAVLKSAGENAFWLGDIHHRQMDWPNAEQYFTLYRDYSDRFVATEPANVDGWLEQSYAHNNLGTVAFKQGKLARAADEFAQSVALKSRILAQTPHNMAAQADYADSLSWLARTLVQQGKIAEAMPLYDREQAVLQALHAAKPDNRKWMQRLALARYQRAELDVARGELASAHAQLALAEADLQALVAHDGTNRDWQRNLLVTRLKQYDLQADQLPLAVALKRLDELYQGLSELSNLNPKQPILQVHLANLELRRAQAYQGQGQGRLAAVALAAAHATLDKAQANAPHDRQIQEARVALLLAQAELARHDQADGSLAALCQQAIALLAPLIGEGADFKLLAPWVRAHILNGQRDKVAAAEQQLQAIGYRDAHYLHFLTQHDSARKR